MPDQAPKASNYYFLLTVLSVLTVHLTVLSVLTVHLTVLTVHLSDLNCYCILLINLRLSVY
jgi:hypothetical protein